MRRTKTQRRIVLVGGGHSHVQVLRHFAMNPPADARLTVVLDLPVAVYSGMVPGFVAGQYAAHELEIDVVPLARRAAARVVLAPATGVDPAARRIHVAERPSISYDVASFDIGSTVHGLDLPGIREHALSTRPIGRFVQRVDDFVERARAAAAAGGIDRRLEVVVVGAGAGGVELAFTLERRLAAELGRAPRVRLLQGAAEILPGSPPAVIARVYRAAKRRGIEIECQRKVVAADAHRLELDGGGEMPYDLLVWVTGATAHGILAGSELPTDRRGFVSTRSTLQVEGWDDLFAVGDCATLSEHPRTPKAGVYAVRQGPVLNRNLEAWLAGKPLERYRPQHDFLALLNLGDGTALGTKWGRVAEGPRVMRLKDWIDRRFMRRFQVLAPDGELTEEFKEQGEMGEGMEMLCGGCAAKLGQSSLARALERIGPGADDPTVRLGLATPDDATAWTSPAGDVLVSSLDAFRAFTDDPYQVGRVAAANAASDLYAKGVTPRYAQALVALPEGRSDDDNEETLVEVLAGVRGLLDEIGVTLLGGHTLTTPELLVGLEVQGVVAESDELLTLDRLEAGQALGLTKPLGTGVLFHADMKGRARGPWIQEALDWMGRTNAAAARIARAAGATAATDVTGFGLAGHLGEMARASRVTARLSLDELPALAGVVELLAAGERSTAHEQNARARRGLILDAAGRDHPRLELLFDPQTSGGLVFGVPEESLGDCLAALGEAGAAAAAIGRVTAARDDGAPLEVAGQR